jgi:hypothetical protein
MARSPSGGARAVATLAFCAAAATATGACNALTGASGLHENDQEAITDPPPVVTPQPSTPVDDGGGGAVVDVYVKPDPPKGCPSEGRSCTPRAPANWEGPLFLYDGDPAMAPQLCPTSMAVQRVDAHGGKPWMRIAHKCDLQRDSPAVHRSHVRDGSNNVDAHEHVHSIRRRHTRGLCHNDGARRLVQFVRRKPNKGFCDVAIHHSRVRRAGAASRWMPRRRALRS